MERFLISMMSIKIALRDLYYLSVFSNSEHKQPLFGYFNLRKFITEWQAYLFRVV